MTMKEENTEKIKKPTINVRIIIPLIIVITIAGIWFIKNSQNTKNIDSTEYALHVTETIDLEKLKSYSLPIVIDFGADSCIPCKEMAPVLKELNEELRGKAIIRFVDVWKYKELANEYPIKLIPTQLLIDAQGNPYKPKKEYYSSFKLYSMKDTGEHVLTTHEGGLTKEQLLTILKEMGMK